MAMARPVNRPAMMALPIPDGDAAASAAIQNAAAGTSAIGHSAMKRTVGAVAVSTAPTIPTAGLKNRRPTRKVEKTNRAAHAGAT